MIRLDLCAINDIKYYFSNEVYYIFFLFSISASMYVCVFVRRKGLIKDSDTVSTRSLGWRERGGEFWGGVEGRGGKRKGDCCWGDEWVRGGEKKVLSRVKSDRCGAIPASLVPPRQSHTHNTDTHSTEYSDTHTHTHWYSYINCVMYKLQCWYIFFKIVSL